MYEAIVVKVLIASPSDLDDERKTIKDAISEWNNFNSEDKKIIFVPIMWETHTASNLKDDIQSTINTQIVNNSDMIIALFWNKLGTKTKMYDSGTTEEIYRFLESDKLTSIYFSHQDLKQDSLNLNSFQRLKTFEKKLKDDKRFIQYFKNNIELKELIKTNLSINYLKLLEKNFKSFSGELSYKVATVTFNTDGSMEATSDMFRFMPLNQEERESLYAISKHSFLKLDSFRIMYGKSITRSLLKKGIIILKDGNIYLCSKEAKNFVDSYCRY